MSEAVIHFDGRQHAAELALSLIQQARQKICFFGHHFDKALFDNEDCIDALRRFALSSPRAHIQILLRDPLQSAVQSQRFILLAEKLTSRISIKQCHDDALDLKHFMLLVDQRGFLHGAHASRYQGQMSLTNPLQCQPYQQQFDTLWQQGHPDPFSRRLHL